MVLLSLLAACTRFDAVDQIELPAAGVWYGFVDDDRGDLRYDGAVGAEQFEVTFTSWATGSTQRQAEDRAADNTWGAVVDGPMFDAWGRSEARRAGVDVAIQGPRVFDVEAITLDGQVALYDVDGYHHLTGSEVVGRGVFGDVDALSYGGIDLQLYPYEGSRVRLEATQGDLWVALPAGLPYSLHLVTDPSWSYELADLGFDEVSLGPGHAFATAGQGTVSVELINHDGPVFVTVAPTVGVDSGP